MLSLSKFSNQRIRIVELGSAALLGSLEPSVLANLPKAIWKAVCPELRLQLGMAAFASMHDSSLLSVQPFWMRAITNAQRWRKLLRDAEKPCEVMFELGKFFIEASSGYCMELPKRQFFGRHRRHMISIACEYRRSRISAEMVTAGSE
jgi:hypothetical protein